MDANWSLPIAKAQPPRMRGKKIKKIKKVKPEHDLGGYPTQKPE